MASKLKPPVHAEPTPTEEPTDVFPYSGDGRNTRLPDNRATGVFRSSIDGAVPSIPSACPDCGEDTVNGAGLFACTHCSWYGAFR